MCLWLSVAVAVSNPPKISIGEQFFVQLGKFDLEFLIEATHNDLTCLEGRPIRFHKGSNMLQTGLRAACRTAARRSNSAVHQRSLAHLLSNSGTTPQQRSQLSCAATTVQQQQRMRGTQTAGQQPSRWLSSSASEGGAGKHCHFSRIIAMLCSLAALFRHAEDCQAKKMLDRLLRSELSQQPIVAADTWQQPASCESLS